MELESTHMTKCAHRFCRNCIVQSIQQYHKCPICNQHLNELDLIRDVTFDSLKDELKDQKRKNKDAVNSLLTNETDTLGIYGYGMLKDVLKGRFNNLIGNQMILT
jgi:hypothetical protein